AVASAFKYFPLLQSTLLDMHKERQLGCDATTTEVQIRSSRTYLQVRDELLSYGPATEPKSPLRNAQQVHRD
ncbi:MAG: hypothetical protein OXC80_06330, partial [Gammaproteobacteria bacterium]|nr:hypothetical protein [Gammaproteobacteria bacterium]